MKPNKVYIKKVSKKLYLQLCWIDPTTGKERRRSAETNRMREAIKAAEKLEKTLERGVPVDSISWHDFSVRYRTEHIATLKKRSRGDWPTVSNSIVAIVDPDSLRDVTASVISNWAMELRTEGRTSGVVARYLRTLRSALRWAENIRLIDKAPYITMTRSTRKKSRGMKGRPITLEEFERMITAVPACVTKMHPPEATEDDKQTLVESWRHLLWGYWYSGIRLNEATELYWDRTDKLCIRGIDRKHPMMLIQQELEKGNRDRLYPLTPDFIAFLRQTPKEERFGRVFKPLTRRGVSDSYTTISRTVTAIGKAARVVVNPTPKKYASAQDLRRSFGTRWAPLVQPVDLQQLMRHKSLSTTMEFYVELRASEVSERLNKAFVTSAGDPLGDPEPESTESANSLGPEESAQSELSKSFT